jgi:hypothetical protein
MQAAGRAGGAVPRMVPGGLLDGGRLMPLVGDAAALVATSELRHALENLCHEGISTHALGEPWLVPSAARPARPARC